MKPAIVLPVLSAGAPWAWLGRPWGWVCAIRGYARRRRGRYDRTSLVLHWRACLALRSPRAWLALVAFRRDLGRPVPRRWRDGLKRLCEDDGATKLSGSLRRRAQALLDHDHGRVQAEMLDLRRDFLVWLQTARLNPPGLCVVGNAAGLSGRGLGPVIDAATAVIRFNRCFSPAAEEIDLGRRTDVWVVSPACREAPPAGLRWAIITGPDPAASLARWPQVRGLREQGVPVLTVPLPVWRAQVSVLQAPPSAGALVLAWIEQAGAGWTGVSSAGIGWGVRSDGRHHLHAPEVTVGRRHQWSAERSQHAGWCAKGLHDLGGH